MQRTSFESMACPIARSLELVGEWWSMLILRDAFHGLSKFDEFEQSLGISPTMLTRRLKYLVQHNILERKLYNAHPARYQYELTQRGKDFFPVLAALFHWGNQQLSSEEHAVTMVDSHSGQPVTPLMIDQHSQQPLTYRTVSLVAGPAASERYAATY